VAGLRLVTVDAATGPADVCDDYALACAAEGRGPTHTASDEVVQRFVRHLSLWQEDGLRDLLQDLSKRAIATGTRSERCMVAAIALTNSLLTWTDGYGVANFVSYNRALHDIVQSGQGCCVDFAVTAAYFAGLLSQPAGVAIKKSHAFLSVREGSAWVGYEPQALNRKTVVLKITNICAPVESPTAALIRSRL